MRFTITWLAASLLIPACAAVAAAQTVTLVRNGRANAAILLSPGATAPMRHGAEELQRFIREMSGATLPILEPGQPGSGGANDARQLRTAKALIAVVSSGDVPGAGAASALGPEEFHITTRLSHNGGTTATPTVLIVGDGQRGAMYGCYALLEDVLGCRWFNSRVSRISKKRTITVGPLDIRQKPAFEYREPYYTEALDRDWAVRNRTNGNFQHLDASVGGRVAYGQFVHTFSSLVPPEQYYDQHPEYFSLINGKRMKGYYQLCLTNPDVLKISIAKVEEWIRANPEATIFSVSQNDTGYPCECDRCQAVAKEEGAQSGVVLRFVDAIADAVAKDHPNVLIDTLAYQWTEDPPKLTKPRPNVRIRLAPIGACVAHGLDKCDNNKHPFDNLAAWGSMTNQLYIWHYSTNFANYLQPVPDLDEIAADIPLFKKHGVVGLFYEGDYAPGGGGEMSELKAYLMARLMWDVNRPAKPIVDEYVDGVYGKAAPYIHRWLDVLHEPERTKNVHAHIYDPPTAPYLSDDIMKQGVQLFDEAEKAAAKDPLALDEVQRARLALEYVQLMRAPTGAERTALAQRVAAKIRKYGIGQVREGQPVDQFLKSIGQ